MKRKKREFNSSELVKTLSKIYGFDEVLTSFRVKDFLEEYLDKELYNEIESTQIKDKILFLKIKSPLLKNDFRMRKSFYLKKISDYIKEPLITDIQVI